MLACVLGKIYTKLVTMLVLWKGAWRGGEDFPPKFNEGSRRMGTKAPERWSWARCNLCVFFMIFFTIPFYWRGRLVQGSRDGLVLGVLGWLTQLSV